MVTSISNKFKTRVSEIGSSQTTEYSSKEMETNTSEKNDMEVQTEIQPSAVTCEVDDEKLAAWLKKIYPKVKKELDENLHSKAFRGYHLSSDTSDANCKLSQVVDVSAPLKDAAIGSHVTALSWNSTNNTLAVSCTYKHNSWCYHEGLVQFYTLDHDDNLPQVPRIKLSTESCVMDLEFHTVLPAIVAAALFSGVIIIWNIHKEEEHVIARVDSHGDSITQLSWIVDINSTKNILLASSSFDGLLSLWDFKVAESALLLKERHQIRSQLLPLPGDSSTEDTIKKVVRGVTCFDFSKHTPEIFIVGAEGGLVVQCSLLGSRKLSGGETPLLDSSFKYYQPHKGEVLSVCFSLTRKDMFMTSGSDLEIRIYVIGQEEPAQIIFLKQPLNCVSWVPFEERIICGCGKNGFIEVFLLVKGKAVEKTTKDKTKPEIMTRIKINKAKSNIVAVGTENGQVQMWRVPWTLFGNMA